MSEHREHEHHRHDHHDEHHVEVAVHSNAGRYPEEGFNRVEATQKMTVEIERAAKALGITHLDKWIAKVGTKDVDLKLSYKENHLQGYFVIDFGPRESGGG